MDALFSSLDKGGKMHEIMRANEVAAGYRVVLPGTVDWLSAADWHPTITVSTDGKTVRLVAILALNPGKGALRRTVAGIMGAGLVPCIVEPTREMRSTMQRWNWKCKRVGYGMDCEEQWRPRKSLKVRQ